MNYDVKRRGRGLNLPGRTEKITKILSKEIRSLGRDLKLGPPKYEVGVKLCDDYHPVYSGT